MDKTVGFAIVGRSGDFLRFEQVSDNGVEIYTTEKAKDATLFNTNEDAVREACSMISGNGKWDYQFLDEDTPIGVVELTILAYVSDIEKLVI